MALMFRVQTLGGKTYQYHNDVRGKIIKLLCSISAVTYKQHSGETKSNEASYFKFIFTLELHFILLSAQCSLEWQHSC